jgi:hypothetical protein
MKKAVKETLRRQLMASPEGFSSKDLRRAKKDHRNGLLRGTQPIPKKSRRQERLRAGNPNKRDGFPAGVIVWPPIGRRFVSKAPFITTRTKREQ